MEIRFDHSNRSIEILCIGRLFIVLMNDDRILSLQYDIGTDDCLTEHTSRIVQSVGQLAAISGKMIVLIEQVIENAKVHQLFVGILLTQIGLKCCIVDENILRCEWPT